MNPFKLPRELLTGLAAIGWQSVADNRWLADRFFPAPAGAVDGATRQAVQALFDAAASPSKPKRE